MLSQKLQEGNYLTLETTPLKLPRLDPILKKLEESGAVELVDGFTTTDSPLSQPKYNSIIAAYRLQQRFGKPVIATVTMRDRNWIALQGDLLAANDLGVTHILALTGDPIKMARIPAKGVFEGNSLKLLELIQNFNRGVDLGGEPFKIPPTPITPFGVTGSVIKNRERFKKKIRAKLERGAVGVITQPVYSVEQARSLLEVMEEVWEEMGERKGELILGFFPITSLKTALFLQKGVPGVEVPQSIVEELERANRKGEERKRGVQLSRDLFGQLWELHPKIHFMCANRFELVPEIVGEVKGN